MSQFFILSFCFVCFMSSRVITHVDKAMQWIGNVGRPPPRCRCDNTQATVVRLFGHGWLIESSV